MVAAELCHRVGSDLPAMADGESRDLCRDFGIKPISPQSLQGVVQQAISRLPATAHNRLTAR